jgi:hypothetical protein
VPRDLSRLPDPDVPGPGHGGTSGGLQAVEAQMAAIKARVGGALAARKRANAEVCSAALGCS